MNSGTMTSVEQRSSSDAGSTEEGSVIFEQHYLDCLSQASYLIGDPTSHKAVVVDYQGHRRSTSPRPSTGSR
ncbi:MAG: hypothetical protein R2716_08805 [Microthrixaceae bacterium]